MKGKEGKRDYAIDLIRSIAIILVIVFHLIFAFHSDNRLRYIGLAGVSLFFIASGYMLAKKYPELESFSLKWFFNRFIKIAALYYLAILVIVILFGSQTYSGLLWKNLGLHFLFLDPLFSNYAYGIISPAWFLTPLICLYLLFPYINRLLKKYAWLCAVFFAIMVCFRLYRGTITDYVPLFFIGEFSFGILLAYKNKILPVVSSFFVLFQSIFAFVPFLLFFLLYGLNLKNKLWQICTFIGVNSLALFLFHESFMNLIIGKWHIYSISIYPALILLLFVSVLAVYLSGKIQKVLRW